MILVFEQIVLFQFWQYIVLYMCRCVALSLLNRYMLTLWSLNVWCLNEYTIVWVNNETNGNTILHYSTVAYWILWQKTTTMRLFIFMYTNRFCDVQNCVVSSWTLNSAYKCSEKKLYIISGNNDAAHCVSHIHHRNKMINSDFSSTTYRYN